jgi:hypothetical protein
MKVHVKYMFHTVKWAVPQNFRDEFFLLSVDNGFFVICLKNSKIQYGNWNFYINFKEISCVVLDTTAHKAPAQKIYIFVFFLFSWTEQCCIVSWMLATLSTTFTTKVSLSSLFLKCQFNKNCQVSFYKNRIITAPGLYYVSLLCKNLHYFEK